MAGGGVAGGGGRHFGGKRDLLMFKIFQVLCEMQEGKVSL